jgi:hypothetical protein
MFFGSLRHSVLRLLDNPPTDMFSAALGIQLHDFANFTSVGQPSNRPVFLAALGILLNDFADFTSVGQPSNRPVLAALGQVPGQLSG